MNAFRVCAVVLSGLFFLGCEEIRTSCGSENCGGCCDARGYCQVGQSDLACGIQGSSCRECQGAECVSGRCEVTGAGGGTAATGGGIGRTGGGVGGTGGTGGAIGQIEQAQVSGTRLKAVRFSSGDGASQTVSLYGLWWDTQLQQYCSVTESRANSPCKIEDQMHRSADGLFADAQCTRPAAHLTKRTFIAALEAQRPYQVLTNGMPSDGGTGYYRRSQRVAQLYKNSGASCLPFTLDSGIEFYEAVGDEVMQSELATFNPVVD